MAKIKKKPVVKTLDWWSEDLPLPGSVALSLSLPESQFPLL